MDRDDFYVGYEPASPRRIAKKVRIAILVFLVLAAIIAVVLASAQRGFESSYFEFGTKREFEGVISSLFCEAQISGYNHRVLHLCMQICLDIVTDHM